MPWVLLCPSQSHRERTCTMTAARDHTPTTFMRSVSVSGFRCFGDEQTVRLAPLTLFVGSNGIGKSSLMALIRVLGEALFSHRLQLDFNPELFDLGGFQGMVHYRGGRGGHRVGSLGGVVQDVVSSPLLSQQGCCPGLCFLSASRRLRAGPSVCGQGWMEGV